MNNSTMNFQEIMAQMQDQIRQEQQVFSTDPENPKRIKVVNEQALLNRALNPLEERMLRRIERVDQYSWNRGKTGGLDTGFPLFNQAIEGGIQSGLILFAASPNVGKSAFMLQILKQISDHNQNVYCEYHSYDDSLNELMPRYIACDQQITIAQAKNPERFADDPDVMERRNEGLKKLYRNVHKFSMLDTEDIGTDIEALEDHIKELKMTLPDGIKIVIGIDSFYDLTTQKKFGNDNKLMFEHIAKTLKSFCQTYDITIMCTAHLRKLNGNRRPTNDDLKETNRLEYEANLICLLYNEVGIKEETADVYWLGEDEEKKMPVLEMKFSKNKYSDFKGTRFYEFVPSQSYFIEAPLESCKRYASLVYQR